MRLPLIALAACLAASATPAAACQVLNCADLALADDSYPVGETPLPPAVRALVNDRFGGGLSLAGFYNDPSLALAARPYAPAGYDYADRGPRVIVDPYSYGHRRVVRRAY